MERKAPTRRTIRIPRGRRPRKRAESQDQLYLDFGDADERLTVSFFGAEERVEDWFHSGCLAEDEGRLQEAAADYRRALELDGSNRVLHFNLGNVLLASGFAAEAVDQFRQAVDLEPGYYEAWNNLGVALSESGDDSAAEAAFRRALANGGSYADALYNLAELLDQAGDTVQAAQYWRAYLLLDAESDWASHARARLNMLPPQPEC
jgi:tetratricopeptide (TPR) repeat protein